MLSKVKPLHINIFSYFIRIASYSRLPILTMKDRIRHMDFGCQQLSTINEHIRTDSKEQRSSLTDDKC